MAYHRVRNYGSTMGATSGAETALFHGTRVHPQVLFRFMLLDL